MTIKVELEFNPITEPADWDTHMILLYEDGNINQTVFFDDYESWDDFLKFEGQKIPVIAWAKPPNYPIELWGGKGDNAT